MSTNDPPLFVFSFYFEERIFFCFISNRHVRKSVPRSQRYILYKNNLTAKVEYGNSR